MSKVTTLKMVAAAAGVSDYTASQAINGMAGIAPATRERVLMVAADLGYVPNRLARSLRKQASTDIGILTANTANSFYARLVAGVDSVVRPAGFHTLVADATDAGAYSTVREAEVVDAFIQRRVAAVILTYQPRREPMGKLASWDIPVVFADCPPPAEFGDYPWVMSDGEGASRSVGEHFAAHEYRHWVFLGHDRGWPSRVAREKGFTHAAKAAGATVHVVEGGNSVTTAHAAMQRYLATRRAKGLDAVFASNELVLNGGVRALGEAGCAIGTDIGVIGFDEFEWASVLNPTFTVVDQDIPTLGAIAGQLAIRTIRCDNAQPVLQVPTPVLRIRRSCGCPA
ncbi:MAG: LacI family DNA-binding transcriptional regulator [Propionibacteriaceae bacterium]|nr:LacI family DNA-binding transcriptional regulator [Propionibacteriaceae bacterium]